ncbi:glycerophosphodiester phosphodiesterase family protein [Promicromonospora iranensis]|uniref:Glycerophosphoryl diester phosphodiesterase n=1 Tax=Promicromonospora iranensis TaxID=1105144 RepID=A0ABU2CHL7_9MICO|nr:glycerophosphodiester phosphodiesterase family protein [Promicromonospora iranensis]MDR7380826.1 glycerophosphoryl diester phosphodiesterase [Promicromonospora iranensis]
MRTTPRRTTAALAVTIAGALALGAAPASAAPAGHPRAFDLQAHRGGVALTVENTLPAFDNALELGVSTLELDVQITQDGYAVVTHDRDPHPAKCVDTEPAFPGDPEFPYVPDRTYIKDLTLAQVRTIDCGSLRQPQFPGQELHPGERMPLLSEVLDLVNRHRARQVTLNIETKVEAGAPEQTAPREEFVQVVAREVRKARLVDQVTIQSFDWGSLMRMSEVEPRFPLVALTNGQQFLQVGAPGTSPWLGGIDIDDFPGSIQEKFVAASASFGADAVSPVHGDPQGGSVTNPGYVPFTTPELVSAAHDAGMAVIPWTINDRATMESLMDIDVDGIITDRPDLLRTIMAERHLKLPKRYVAPVPRY